MVLREATAADIPTPVAIVQVGRYEAHPGCPPLLALDRCFRTGYGRGCFGAGQDGLLRYIAPGQYVVQVRVE